MFTTMFIRLTVIYNFSSFVFFIEINLTDEDSNLSRNVWKYGTLSLHFFWTLKPTKYNKNIQIKNLVFSVIIEQEKVYWMSLQNFVFRT